MNERWARVALSRLAEPGDLRVAEQVARLGACQVYELLAEERDLSGLHTDLAARLRGLDPAAELERADRLGVRYVIPGDEEWPAGLFDLDRTEPLQRRGGAPLGMWVKGSLRLDQAAHGAVAVVGSRSATAYGAQVASDIAAHVAGSGTPVVSGAAFGIDQAAHRGALAQKGPTVAVLACGVDRAYPAAHRALLNYIAETGLVVSELPVGAAPTRVRFLARNRLIAAMTRGTVVVEAALRSGALNTANWASRLNRVVMGVPGPVTSAPSQGVHEMIRTRGAELVTRGEDVLELVAPSGSFLAEAPRGPVLATDVLTDRERQVLDAVPAVVPADTTSVARTGGVGPADTVAALGRLAGLGLVEQTAGGWKRRRDTPAASPARGESAS